MMFAIKFAVSIFVLVAFCGCPGLTDAEEVSFPLKRGNYLRYRSNAAHCGIYSLAAALKAVHVDPCYDTLLSGKYIGTRKGSSAADLVDAAKAHHAGASVYQNASVQFLRGLDNPAILLLRNTRRADGTNHWITFLGFENGNAIILDAPREIEPVPIADLMAHWEGIAIVVSEKNEILSSTLALNAVQAKFNSLFWFLAVAVGFVIGVPALSRAGFLRKGKVATLVGGATLLGCIHHSVATTGFFRNPRGIDYVAFAYRDSGDRFPVISFNELTDGIAAKRFNLLDARVPPDFAQEHIDGALNFPVDASLGEFTDAIGRINPDKPIVTYCMGPHCQWGHLVADRLYKLGFRNISVYEEGWIEYEYLTSRQARKK